jgi:hypothetical protein
MADAFDVVGRRKLADNLYEAAFEISVRNHKDEAVTVNVIEPMLSDWEILSTSHAHRKRTLTRLSSICPWRKR